MLRIVRLRSFCPVIFSNELLLTNKKALGSYVFCILQAYRIFSWMELFKGFWNMLIILSNVRATTSIWESLSSFRIFINLEENGVLLCYIICHSSEISFWLQVGTLVPSFIWCVKSALQPPLQWQAAAVALMCHPAHSSDGTGGSQPCLVGSGAG